MAERKPDDAEPITAPPGSIEQLYAALESALLGYAERIVTDSETAQDIVQEAFLKLHAEFERVRQPQAWLYRTVHNLALNHLRAGRKIVPLAPQDSDQAETPDPLPLPDEQIQRLEAIGQTRLCLDGLDARSQELIRLKFEQGLSYKEISAATQLSVSNVGYLLHHALKHLAAALKKNGVIS
ncbi:MAG: RNA polymerase sigma factor [Verrucomicrobiota bacterium]